MNVSRGGWLGWSFFFTLACATALGQTQAINGSIRGRITDPTGVAIPGAQVTVVNQNTGFTRAMQSNDEGYYVFVNLPLGTYQVTIQKQGFATEQHPGIVLNAGTDAVVDAQMQVGSVSTEINVTNNAPVIEPARVDTGRTIDHQAVDNLPRTSRNPYNFILFQPGVSGHPNPELGIPRTLNTNGQMDRVNYQLDGMTDTESDRYGLRLFPISNTYVREVETVANSFAPEFGNTTGIIYNVITNSVRNELHGQFQWLRRPVSTSSRPMLLKPTQPKPDLQLNDYAANGGGPILKDRLFFFAGYEHLRRGFPSPVTIDPAAAAQIGIPSNLLATAPSISHAQFFNVRVDWNINAKNRAFVRYNYFRNDFPFNTNVGGLFALDAASDFRDRAHVVGLQLVTTFSARLLNELRFSWPYRNEKHVPNPLTGPGPAILIQGVANFNGTTAAGDAFQEKIPGFNDNLTFITGPHTLKTGGYVNHILDNNCGDTFTQYIFPSINAYLQAKSGANPFAYSTYRASIGNTCAGYHSLFGGAFLQDSWQVTPRLMLIYGLRWDKYLPPDANPNAPFVYSRHFASPSGNVQPRIGLAWQVTEKTVVRASFGKFYDAPPTNLWFNA